MECPICQSNTESIGAHYDDRFGHVGMYVMRECLQCGHCFNERKFTEEELSRLYTTHYQRAHADTSKFVPAHVHGGFSGWLEGERQASFCWVPERVSVLDVGCGMGETVAYHAARGCNAVGIDVDENVKRAADELGLSIMIGALESRPFAPGSFDYVTMDQVVEHFPDPQRSLSEALRILKPEGRLILSTPNAHGWGRTAFGRRWVNWHAPYHLNLFSKRSIAIAAAQAGFDVERIESITASRWLYYQLIHLLFYPKPGEPSLYWSAVRQFTGWRLWVRRAIKLMYLSRLTHIVNRIFDALGKGDCMVVVLRKK